jgi:seryl-tRNA synthetase
MHDIKAIRANPDAFDAAMARRGIEPVAKVLLEADATVRKALQDLETARAEHKRRSREVGRLKAQGQRAEADELIRQSTEWLVRNEQHAGRRVQEADEVLDILQTLPNILDPEVPDGPDESANRVLHQHGEPPRLDFPARQHFEIGEALGLMDFAAAAKLAGSRFTVLRGALARLERALGQWMLDLHTDEHGYTETAVPLLVNDAAMYGTNQLPKFAEDSFRTTDGRWLIATSEIPLANLAAGEILPESALPMRVTALTPCFRSEAGSAGRDTRGMLRQHQFSKVELVSVTRPEDSDAEHERMTRCAERVLTQLGLAWRRVLLSSGDTGFGSARTYDLEVWLPGQGAWREISSCSNMRDFQARRMGARYRPAEGKGTAFVHTLNGSGVAVGRALIAVMETYQTEDGSVTIPAVLRPWMGGIERIGE